MAVAVILAALRGRRNRGPDAVDDRLKDQMDANEDGNVSLEELQRSLRNIAVRADRMQARLQLERDMAQMILKLPNFCVCVGLFLVAIYQFSPAASKYKIHKHIEDHFQLRRASSIKSLNDIYTYMEDFEHYNMEMQATSSAYWCEHRYATHKWSEELMVPVWGCPSPRLYSLGLVTDSAAKWSAASASSSSSSSSGHHDDSHSTNSTANDTNDTSDGGAHRRLSRRMASSGSSSGNVPPCVDNDHELQIEENNPHVTCASSARDHHHVCEHDLGILLCPLTCGFCSPFNYDHLKRFEKPQVTMLPTMVYQTRYPKAECHGFAHTYEMQPHNPALVLLPALDGERHGRVLTCIDRTGTQEDDYAIELPCPEGSPTSHCENNVTKITHKHTFHGITVYPELLIEPHRDIMAMRAVEWIDLQTAELTVSTMVYTEDLEIFTSVSAIFTVDEAGNVQGSHTMISYTDLISGSKSTFIACLIICSIGALLGVFLSAAYMYKHPQDCKWGYQAYEFFSRAALLIYPLLLLIQWSQQVPMATEYDHLLHTFLDMKDMSYSSVDASVQTFFDVKTEIYAETSWLKRQRIVAYIVCYIQFLQLIFYFNAHPKMGVLTATVYRALDQTFHFLLLFSVLFLMLGFMAHWMLGEILEEFGSFNEALISQSRMVFGEFIQASRAPELQGSMKAMYWIYAATFMLVVWMTLLNFILAIVVDAFVDVKGDNAEKVFVRNFILDFCGTFYTTSLSYKRQWPSLKDLIDFLDESIEEQTATKGTGPKWQLDLESAEDEEKEDKVPICTVEALWRRFPSLQSDQAMAVFLHHYYGKCKSIICRAPRDGGEVKSRAFEAKAEDQPTLVKPANFNQMPPAKQQPEILMQIPGQTGGWP